VKTRVRRLAAAAALLSAAKLGVRFGVLAVREPGAAAQAAAPSDRAPPVRSAPPSSRSLVEALPPMKAAATGTTWSATPAKTQPPIEAQRGAPDIRGAQPLKPPPSNPG
jgi:hypothetical protein